MSILALKGPFNQLDVFRITDQFDADHFGVSKSKNSCYPLDEAVAMGQFGQKLYSTPLITGSGLPIDVLDLIMRSHLNDCPSVATLLAIYKNTILPRYALPFAQSTLHLNDASKDLLQRLGQVPSIGNLAGYRQLMTLVFRDYFSKLTLDQKLELIRRSSIWENKSGEQKVELFGRIQAPTHWGQFKVLLQVQSWKIQLAVIRVLNKGLIEKYYFNSITRGLRVISLIYMAAFMAAANSLVLRGVAAKLVWKVMMTILYEYRVRVVVLVTSVFGGIAIALTLLLMGSLLRISVFSVQLNEKGKWIQELGLTLLKIEALVYSEASEMQERMLKREIKNLEQTLMQSIDEAQITVDQARLTDAYLPELLEKWHQLTAPSMVQALDQG